MQPRKKEMHHLENEQEGEPIYPWSQGKQVWFYLETMSASKSL